MENFKKNAMTAYTSGNHVRLMTLMNNKTWGKIIPQKLLREILIPKFCETIVAYGEAPILQRRGVTVTCVPEPVNARGDFTVRFIDHNTSTTIAELMCGLSIKSDGARTYFSVKISLGRTENRYSSKGNLRPTNNGPGYGTIIRAFVCAAAKKLGAIGVDQSSAFLSVNNKSAALAGTLKQPVSAYIMNKLGFNKNLERNGVNPLAPHSRVLLFKNVKGNWTNRPTPELNAVMNTILRM
jgi:hypothetical protein